MTDGCLGQFQFAGALRMTLMMSDPRCLAIGGDVDETTYPSLVGMLGELARSRREVHVDLSAVEYCDLAGLRAIIRLATAERTVVLHGLPAHLHTVLGILGWDSTPGLVIDPKPSGFRLPSADLYPVLPNGHARRATSAHGAATTSA